LNNCFLQTTAADFGEPLIVPVGHEVAVDATLGAITEEYIASEVNQYTQTKAG
jgi:hypothetical protein